MVVSGKQMHDLPQKKVEEESCPSHYINMAEKLQRLDSGPENTGRASFSSIREQDSDLAQTFTSSKVSSYAPPPESAVEEAPAAGDMISAQFAPSLLQPSGRLHGCWHPAGLTSVHTRRQLGNKSSRSTAIDAVDLRGLNADWDVASSLAETYDMPAIAPPVEDDVMTLEDLPIEIYNLIVGHLVLDIPPNGIERRNRDLMSLLLTSKKLYQKTLGTLFRHVTIPHSRIFRKLLAQLVDHPERGQWVRRIDFSHFNPHLLFSTANERAQARNLTSQTLLQVLELTPNLRELLAQEYVEEDLSTDVLQKVFTGLARLDAVDFCGCSSATFGSNFYRAVHSPAMPDVLEIRRLSLHRCLSLPSSIFETLLPKLRRLTHLDVAGTMITDAALRSIPASARITHLNLAKCLLLSPNAVVDFLTGHPAVRDSLVFLSISTGAGMDSALGEEQVSRLLSRLPRTLRSLSLRGCAMDAAQHLPLLLPLTKQLEELALGSGLRLRDVDQLLHPGKPDPSLPEDKWQRLLASWTPHTLRFLDLSDMEVGPGLELDLSALYTDSALLTWASAPLEVVELSETAFKRLRKTPGAPLNRMGWRVSEVGARSWLVRDAGRGARAGAETGDGHRPWKMGAQSWGMRKIPVAVAEVGGMYGSYMFGRKL